VNIAIYTYIAIGMNSSCYINAKMYFKMLVSVSASMFASNRIRFFQKQNKQVMFISQAYILMGGYKLDWTTEMKYWF